MEMELKGIVGRDQDLVDRAAVERNRNYLRKKAILGSLKQLYVVR